MCALSAVLMFVLAHIVAWSALGGGWRGAARAPIAVLGPALALLILNAVMNDSYASLGLMIGTLIAWELLFFFGYICLRIMARPAQQPQSLPRR